MKIQFAVTITLFIIIFACSIPNEPGDIAIEDYKISISFDREAYEFGDLKIKLNLDAVNFPESVLVDPITDTTHVDFDSLYVGNLKDSVILRINSGISIDPGIYVPTFTTADSIIDIPKDNMLDWAVINSGEAKITIANTYNDLHFNSVRCRLIRRNDPYSGDPSLQSPDGEVILPDRVIIDTILTDILPNSRRAFDVNLERKWLTGGMSFAFTAENKELLGEDNNGINDTQFLGIDLMLNKCRFDSVSADFSAQTVEEVDYYSTKVDNIQLRYIVAKNAELGVTAENRTAFLLNIGGRIDSLYNLRQGNYPMQIESVTLNPGEFYIYNPVTIDSCKLVADYENQQTEIVTVSKCLPPNPWSSNYTKFVRYANESVFTYEAKGSNTNDKRMGFYELDGVISEYAVPVPEKTAEFSDDLNWDEFAGLNIDDATLKLAVSFPRKDLYFQDLKVKEFRIWGKNTDGTESDTCRVNDINFKYNFNRDTVQIYGLEPVLSFKPDSLVYKADLLLTYDGKLYDTDRLDMDIIIEMPVTITLTDSVCRRNEIEEIDALVEEDDIIEEIKSLKINAFINNPIDSVKALFVVKIADQADTATQELQGNIETLLKVWLMKNPDGTNGYMLNDLPENQELGITGEGISFPPDVLEMMLHTDTYMQSTITVYPDAGNQATVTLSKDDYIEAQIKFSGEIKLNTEGGE